MLSVRNLTKRYAARQGGRGVHAVDGVSFDVAKGDFFTLLGPSGCGKSTTLQCIAGLESPDEGEIEMAGEVVLCTRRNLLVPANRRNIGMIFQSYAIWPHMTVFDNVAFPLVHGQHRQRGAEVKRRVMQALEMVRLADYAERPSPHLSGGQQQRVALARALVHEPRLLLLDEPLSNLDAKLRDAMRVELRVLVKSLGITTVFVTHDQLEAMSMSDQIALMRSGKVVQLGPPREVYLRPNSAFAADFMGRSNMLPGVCASKSSAEAPRVTVSFGELRCARAEWLRDEAHVLVVIRPQAITASLVRPDASHANVFQARIERLQFLGDAIEAEATVGDAVLRVMLDAYLQISVGQTVWLALPPERCVVVQAPEGAPDLAAIQTA